MSMVNKVYIMVKVNRMIITIGIIAIVIILVIIKVNSIGITIY